MISRIAFLAVSQAHQYLHWLPAALRLAAEPGVEVSVLGTSSAGLEFIRSYDPGQVLRLEKLRSPFGRDDDLFTPPPRWPVLHLNHRRIARFPTLVTTETTSGLLRLIPGFKSRLVLIKHGAGDRDGSYNPKHALFDLVLVNGEKHRRALLSRRLVDEDRCIVTGNAKLELIRPPNRIFPDDKPLALYNPHFSKKLSSWFTHGRRMVQEMKDLIDWNFVIAPHVKLRGGPSFPTIAPNLIFDTGSARSIDMTYTQASDVYIGDVSSQVYEFIQQPRPCIFLNFKRIAWHDDPAYAHWKLGQVIQRPSELPAALANAHALHPSFAPLQEQMRDFSMDQSSGLASERQARAILECVRG